MGPGWRCSPTCASGCWRQNESLTVQKNPNYWQKGYPKANSITFVPVVEAALRRAESLGGTRVMGPATSPSGLVVGHFTDPEGTLIGVAGVA